MTERIDKLRPTQPFLVLETQDFQQEIYLKHGISHFYTFRLDKTKNIMAVPDSCVDMLFEYDGKSMTAYAIGSPIKGVEIEWKGKREYFGVRFMPGSMPVGLNVTLRELVDCRFYLEDILMDSDGTFVKGMEKQNTFHDRINYFLKEYENLEKRQEKPFGKMEILMAVKDMAYNSGGLIKVSEMAERVGYTERYINKIFIEQMGFSPKVFCKIIQFQRSLEFLNYGTPERMTEAAVNLGYYDQPQFIRDFKTYCGMTPKRYLTLTKRIRYESRVKNTNIL
ncbi:MAG: helix-turn-helix domain-containing protein [Lachnospira sp.]|nr:helix-turn-helix domain-containing protein [Lachnospira sp.]